MVTIECADIDENREKLSYSLESKHGVVHQSMLCLISAKSVTENRVVQRNQAVPEPLAGGTYLRNRR